MRRNFGTLSRPALALVLFAAASRARAQVAPGWGRVSIYAQATRTSRTDGGPDTSYNEVNASVTLHSPSTESGGLEYAVDVRGATYPAVERDSRASIYEAWVGGRIGGGALGLRIGQMYIADMGALGAVGGAALEARAGALRFGAFGGLEPKSFEAGYVADVRKLGGYVALDGERGRRHVLGYVTIRNGGLAERNVVTLTNFVPLGQSFFLYQTGEYDLTGPAGLGNGGLGYLFVTARWAPVTRVEIQGTYQHGRSIDSRTITLDQIAGRPIDARSLQGFLFDSAGGRLTLEVLRGVRIWGGFFRDKNNRDDTSSNRYAFGASAMNLAGSGFDLTASDNRTRQQGGSDYDAWFLSLGRSLGQRIYLSVDYSTSLSVLRVTDSGGLTIENRPRSRRYGLSAVVNLTRALSILLSAEQLRDDVSRDNRGLLGLTFRF